MRTFNNARKVIVNGIEDLRPSPVRAVTVKELGGAFGSDKHRRLVVSCEAGDVIVIRPQGTQRPSSMTAVDIYRYMLRNEAAKAVLEKARAKKQRLIDARLNAKIARADRKLRMEARADA